MKKQLLTLALSALSFSSFAKIMIVDNNGNNPQNYTSLQKAIDDSGKGDTLYVKGSSIDYGVAVVKNSLVLIGDGYANPTIGRPNARTTLTELTFEGDDASNSQVKGFFVNSIVLSKAYVINSLKIKNSYVGQIHSIDVSEILSFEIVNNLINSISLHGTVVYNSVIANNIICNKIQFKIINYECQTILIPGYNQIKNNLIFKVIVQFSFVKNNYIFDLNTRDNLNSWFIDNGFTTSNHSSNDIPCNSFQGNIAVNASLPYSNPNPVDGRFEINPNVMMNSYDYHVSDTQGQVHDEIGIFSGTYAWVDGTQQQPGLMPSVHSINIDNKYLPSNDTLKVNFKAKSIRD